MMRNLPRSGTPKYWREKMNYQTRPAFAFLLLEETANFLAKPARGGGLVTDGQAQVALGGPAVEDVKFLFRGETIALASRLANQTPSRPDLDGEQLFQPARRFHFQSPDRTRAAGTRRCVTGHTVLELPPL